MEKNQGRKFSGLAVIAFVVGGLVVGAQLGIAAKSNGWLGLDSGKREPGPLRADAKAGQATPAWESYLRASGDDAPNAAEVMCRRDDMPALRDFVSALDDN